MKEKDEEILHVESEASKENGAGGQRPALALAARCPGHTKHQATLLLHTPLLRGTQ